MWQIGFAWALWVASAVAGPEERLYGRVTTAGGQVHEGFLRWGDEGAVWSDLLAGVKTLPQSNLEQARALRRELDPGLDRASRTIEFQGVRITWDIDDTDDALAASESGIRFGHVRVVRPVTPERWLVELKSGVVVELSRDSARAEESGGVEVAAPGGETALVPWRRLQSVELLPAPPSAPLPAERVHGTVRDGRGNTYTGYLIWDGRAVLSTDPLQGEDGPETALRFGEITDLRLEGTRLADIGLAAGGRTTLASGSDRRWLRSAELGVTDARLGHARLSLSSVEEIRLHPPSPSAPYASFQGGARLFGTVTTAPGAEHRGFIRWDNDEEHSWEMLNGRGERTDFAVELGQIREIRRRSSRSAEVTLLDGREIDLSGSNDVGWGHKGIVVESDDGTVVLVDWVEFRQVRFERP